MHTVSAPGSSMEGIKFVSKDELDEGSLVELARLPDLVETFFAITVPRRRPNPLLQELVAGARARSRRVGSAPL